MKTIRILSSALIPSDVEGQMKIAHVGSVLEVDDTTAGALVAAHRAALAEPGTKLVDTTKAIEAAADKRAATAAAPDAAMAAMIAAAVKAALSATAPAPQQPLV